MSRGTFSTLQHLLKQAYSVDVSEQQQAAIELSNLIEQAGGCQPHVLLFETHLPL